MKLCRSLVVALAICCFSSALRAQSVYPGLFPEKMKVKAAVGGRVETVPLKYVRLLPSRWRENMERDSAWMMSLPVASVVHSFQTQAGVWAGREGGYMTVGKLGGWESPDCELRGHAVGHLMSALALIYAQTGSEAFRLKGDSIVGELKKCQRADGYLSAYAEGLIDRNIRGESVWAPWYTLHKILSGLIDQYLYADNADALSLACGMGTWAYEKLHHLSDSTRRLMIRNEFGGVNEAFYNLYALTGERKYKAVAEFFYHDDVIDPLRRGVEEFGTKHTNTFIPKVIAEARRYEIEGAEESRRSAEFFFKRMLRDHTFVTGCSSDKEHYFSPKEFSKHLSGYTGETCCTYNMLKLARHIFTWTADAAVADYYERALINQILGQQDPATGMVHYFQPMLSGAYKLYSTPTRSFWCCVGSGFENHAKYGEAIYYVKADSLYVNLYIPSELKLDGLTLRQTDGEISVSASRPTVIRLRYPSWSGRPKITLNGRKVSVRQRAQSYIDIPVSGEARIAFDFPMSIHAETAHGDASRVALLYGPYVMAAQVGHVGNPFSDPAKYNDYYTYDYHVPEGIDDSLSIDLRHPDRALLPTAQPLTFKTPRGTTVSPLYDIHHQRYVVYFRR